MVPGKDGKLIEPRNKVPSSGSIASYEDSDRKDGEGVHRIAVATLSAFRVDGSSCMYGVVFPHRQVMSTLVEAHNDLRLLWTSFVNSGERGGFGILQRVLA